MIYKTLQLDVNHWDIQLNEGGHLAIASDSYAVAQDVACAVSCVLGEHIFDTTLGLPMFDEILGHTPSTAFIQSEMEDTAKTISAVDKVKATISPTTDGRYQGRLTLLTTWGQEATLTL